MLSISRVDGGHILPVNGKIIVSPDLVSLEAGETQQFTAQMFGIDTNAGVSWSIITGDGAIDTNGLYTAPSSGTDGDAWICATAVAASGFAHASYTITDEIICNVQVRGTYARKDIDPYRGILPQSYGVVISSTDCSDGDSIYVPIGGPDIDCDEPELLLNTGVWIHLVDSNGNTIVGSSSATFAVHGATEISTTLTTVSDGLFLYTASDQRGYPSSGVSSDTIHISYESSVGTITKDLTFIWKPDRIYSHLGCSKQDGIKYVSTGTSYPLEFYFRGYTYPAGIETVLPVTVTCPVSIYSDGIITTSDFSPSGGVEVVGVSQAYYPSETLDYRLIYDMRVDSITPTGASSGDTITVSGGIFHEGMVIVLNGTTVVNEYTLAPDKKSLTFTMPSVKIGYSDTLYKGQVYLTILYGKEVDSSNLDKSITKRTTQAVFMR